MKKETVEKANKMLSYLNDLNNIIRPIRKATNAGSIPAPLVDLAQQGPDEVFFRLPYEWINNTSGNKEIQARTISFEFLINDSGRAVVIKQRGSNVLLPGSVKIIDEKHIKAIKTITELFVDNLMRRVRLIEEELQKEFDDLGKEEGGEQNGGKE